MEYRSGKSKEIINIIRFIDATLYLVFTLCTLYIGRFESILLFVIFFGLMYMFAHRLVKGIEKDKVENTKEQ